MASQIILHQVPEATSKEKDNEACLTLTGKAKQSLKT
jgi:hypothetical protein